MDGHKKGKPSKAFLNICNSVTQILMGQVVGYRQIVIFYIEAFICQGFRDIRVHSWSARCIWIFKDFIYMLLLEILAFWEILHVTYISFDHFKITFSVKRQ